MFEHKVDPSWAAVERYLSSAVVHPDSSLQHAVDSATEAGMPAIEVAPNSGKLLNLLVQISGAKNVLEIGTLAAYSTIWMAKALPDTGRVVTCEYLPEHAAVARKNLEAAGLADRVDIRVGAALDTLPMLESEGEGPFDFVFIDADKQHNTDYLEWAIRLGRPGTVIVLDNAVWEGVMLDPSIDDVNGPGIRAALQMLGEDLRLDATVMQTVGGKGWDGFALAVVR